MRHSLYVILDSWDRPNLFISFFLKQVGEVAHRYHTVDSFKYRLNIHLTSLTNCNVLPSRRLHAPQIQLRSQSPCAIQILLLGTPLIMHRTIRLMGSIGPLTLTLVRQSVNPSDIVRQQSVSPTVRCIVKCHRSYCIALYCIVNNSQPTFINRHPKGF